MVLEQRPSRRSLHISTSTVLTNQGKLLHSGSRPALLRSMRSKPQNPRRGSRPMPVLATHALAPCPDAWEGSLQETFLEKIRSENPGMPCFVFGHSTGGAVVLKAALLSRVMAASQGIVLTSPALRVKPAHALVGAVAPIFSLVLPKYQFKGANKRGIPVSRDPAAVRAKYSDPLVYTGPIRIRTGHEILRISSYLMQNLRSVRVPFLVLHGTADRVTDPLASQELFDRAGSKHKDIRLYEGFLHDLLFEPERDEIGRDIIKWMEGRLQVVGN